MPYTPSYTLANHYALEQAIADGAQSVKYDDKLVQYRSLEEMLQILRLMKAALGVDGVDGKVAGRFGKVFGKTSKALD